MAAGLYAGPSWMDGESMASGGWVEGGRTGVHGEWLLQECSPADCCRGALAVRGFFPPHGTTVRARRPGWRWDKSWSGAWQSTVTRVVADQGRARSVWFRRRRTKGRPKPVRCLPMSPRDCGWLVIVSVRAIGTTSNHRGPTFGGDRSWPRRQANVFYFFFCFTHHPRGGGGLKRDATGWATRFAKRSPTTRK